MKTFKNWLAVLSIGLTSNAFATSPVASPVAEQSLYNSLGVSSTTLFYIMTGVTLFLLIVVVVLAGVVKHLIKIEIEKVGKAVKILIAGLLIAYSNPSFAAETYRQSTGIFTLSETGFWLFVGMDISLVLLIFYLKSLINSFMPEGIKKPAFSPWKRFAKKMTGEVIEVEEETSILMDHEYDGIHELDNDLPPWWKYGFYITIVWAVGYFGYYQVLGIGLSQEEEYITEMLQGEADVEAYKAAHPELINAENVELLTDASSISQGKEIFNTYCLSCHAENGVGGIGPNLTDKYWIYDGDIKGVFTSVSEGRKNGMVAWKEFIAPDKIQLVASYILSLDEVNAPVGKEPQGENIFE